MTKGKKKGNYNLFETFNKSSEKNTKRLSERLRLKQMSDIFLKRTQLFSLLADALWTLQSSLDLLLMGMHFNPFTKLLDLQNHMESYSNVMSNTVLDPVNR